MDPGARLRYRTELRDMTLARLLREFAMLLNRPGAEIQLAEVEQEINRRETRWEEREQ
jgi:hypothetical protein